MIVYIRVHWLPLEVSVKWTCDRVAMGEKQVFQLEVKCGVRSFIRGGSLRSQPLGSCVLACLTKVNGNVTSFLPLLCWFFFFLFLFLKKLRNKDRSRTCPKKVIMLSSSTPPSSPPYPRQQVIPSACSVPLSSLLFV